MKLTGVATLKLHRAPRAQNRKRSGKPAVAAGSKRGMTVDETLRQMLDIASQTK